MSTFGWSMLEAPSRAYLVHIWFAMSLFHVTDKGFTLEYQQHHSALLYPIPPGLLVRTRSQIPGSTKYTVWQ